MRPPRRRRSKQITPTYDDKTSKLQLLKVGFSQSRDGKEDAWSYAAPDGATTRIEVSTKRDGKVSRIEHYTDGKMTKAEEDTDGDGKMDTWERTTVIASP